MNRFSALLLSFCFLTLGSGALEFLHNAQHASQDAKLAQAAGSGPVHPLHDDSNCETHAQLHMPVLTAGWVPLLVCLGLFVAFLTLLEPSLVSQPFPARISCRGPPVR